MDGNTKDDRRFARRFTRDRVVRARDREYTVHRVERDTRPGHVPPTAAALAIVTFIQHLLRSPPAATASSLQRSKQRIGPGNDPQPPAIAIELVKPVLDRVGCGNRRRPAIRHENMRPSRPRMRGNRGYGHWAPVGCTGRSHRSLDRQSHRKRPGLRCSLTCLPHIRHGVAPCRQEACGRGFGYAILDRGNVDSNREELDSSFADNQ
jgi:hypothetical protein